MICLLLLQLGQQGQTASLGRIREGVKAAVPGLEEQEVAGTVHRALRTLIKTRRVYYTGRGYFLVSPEQGSQPADWAQQRRRLRHLVDASCQSQESQEGSEKSPEGSETPDADQGWGRVWQTEGAGARLSSNTSLTDVRRLSTTSLLPDSWKSHHPPSSLGCHSLERTHSLRGRQDREARGRKGGSLRLKGHRARQVLEELSEGREQADNGDLPGQPESDGRMKGPESENDGRARKLERKNSLLGRLFGRKKCATASEEERTGTEAVKEILVLSAQFPPPDMHIPKVMPQRSPVTLASLRMALPASPKRHRQLPR